MNLPGKPRAWRVDVSTSMDLLLLLPAFLSSLVIVSLVSEYTVPQLSWLPPVLWVASGIVIFLPATEKLIALLKYGVRQPAMHELQALEPHWNAVCRAAGVPAHRYTLWIQETDDVNAFAAAGHIVAVTRRALLLPPHHLEAVLAHELGHHLCGHAWVSMLGWYYELPARLSVRIIGFLVHAILAIGRVFLAFGNALFALAAVVCALVLLAVLFGLNPWLLLMPVISVLLAWSSRLAEKRADRVAAQLGYGPALVEVLHSWIEQDGDVQRRGVRMALLATHPSHTARIGGLMKYI